MPLLGRALGGTCRLAMPHRLAGNHAGPGRIVGLSDSPSMAHVFVSGQAQPMPPRVVPCSDRASLCVPRAGPFSPA
jgi:hypothetical protein